MNILIYEKRENMKTVYNSRKTLLAAGFLLISFGLMTVSIFASTEYAMQDKSIWIHYCCLGMALIFWIAGQVLFLYAEQRTILGQFLIVDAIVASVFFILIVTGRENLKEVGREKYITSYLIIIFGCVIPISISFANKIKLIKYNRRFVKKRILEHKYLLCLLLIVLIISALQSGSEPRWDGTYLFQYMQDIWLASIFNMGSLSFCGHISMAFVALNEILAVVFGNLALGMTIATIFLLLSSICSVYGILKMLLSDRSDLEYTLLTACYAVSPFILGLAGYNYWDNWVITMFPIVIYFAMKQQWVYHFVVAFLLCFVKETAVVAYGAYCMAYLLVDLWKRKNLKQVITSKKYWGMLAIGLTWLIVYVVLPNWNGVGAFAFDGGYVIEKLKVLYILNFNWCLTILGTIALFFIKRKNINIGETLIPILVSDVVFILFSCLFKTVNHARYINTHIIVLNILAILGIGLITNRKIRYAAAGLTLAIMLMSNYRTVDPFSKAVFKQYDIGDTVMISTCVGEYLSDSMVYNQQYRYFDKALNLALREIIDEGALICFPQINGRSWFFEGIYADTQVDEIQTQYWDEKKGKRVLVENNDSIPFSLCNITTQTKIERLLEKRTGYFFYIPCAGTDVANMIRENTEILEEKEFSYRGWKVTRLKFEARG